MQGQGRVSDLGSFRIQSFRPQISLFIGLITDNVCGTQLTRGRATHVPVGEDQKQHIEFSRYTANSFNHLYGPIFPVPEALICEIFSALQAYICQLLIALAPSKRVMSLKEPTSKMSKSHADERSRILLTDSSDDIHKKIKIALTDSFPTITYDPVSRPGVSNLIEILAHIEGKRCTELALEYHSASLRSFKEHVASRLSGHLSDIRERYFSLMEDRTGYLDVVADKGAQVARSNADATLQQVKHVLGL